MFALRPLCAQDYRSVKDIFENAFDTHLKPITDLGISWKYRSKPHSLGVFRSGDLLGFAIVSFHTKNGINRYVDYLAVHSSFRGHDIGSMLLKAIISECHAGHTSVHLYPLPFPKLVAWYKSHGFYDTYGGYLNLHSYDTRSALAR